MKWGSYHWGLIDGVVDFGRWLWRDKASLVAGTVLLALGVALVYLVPWVQSEIQGVLP